MIKKTAIPRRNESIVVEKILDDEIILYNKTSHTIHSLNKTAGIVWDLCDGTMPVDEMISFLTGQFKGNSKVIEEDVKKTLQEMCDKNLITLE